MKKVILFIFVIFLGSNLIAQQKDTVVVAGFYETSQYGTLNDAIDAARAGSTINNTVFKLNSYEAYVLNRSIFMSFGEKLEIVAPKPLKAGDADAETVQNSAPPQIVWTEEDLGDNNDYIIQTYGDVTLKNIWIRHADFLGGQLSTSIVFEDSVAIQGDDVETGIFEGVIFDFCPIGAEAGGAITIKADHFVGIFKDCYFRNLSDNHFQYYGRAISFPFQSSGFHYDSLLFENCTFTNISRIVMQEGNEYGENVHINHCTMLNSIEWVYQSQGEFKDISITNSIFVNPNMIGYRPVDVCDAGLDYDDFEDGLCDGPGGGLLNGITPVDSFGHVVPFTDFDRSLFIGNNAYLYLDYALDWFPNSPGSAELRRNRLDMEIRHPSPMLSEDEIAFIDSVDGEDVKVFTKMNVDWPTIYSENPGFLVEATNQDTFLLFVEGKWYTGLDIQWAYEPYAGFIQQWPLPENLAYTNATYLTAAIGGFPLGDLNWFPEQRAAWEVQRDAQWTTINNWLDYGSPDGPQSVKEIPGTIPSKYVLNQNYPNPFNPATKIEYSLPRLGSVSLKIYNLLGQEVATIFEGFQQAGNYIATFDGSGLSSGIYIYRLESEGVSISKKLVLMK
jgi:hypothetical protein